MKELKVVAYVRTAQVNIDIADLQEENIKDYAKANGLKIEKVYKDLGVSGRDYCMPKFGDILDKVKNGEVDIILVSDSDRIGRNVLELEKNKMLLEAHNTKLIAVRELN